MRRAFPLFLLSFVLGFWPGTARAAAESTVDVVKVDGSIDRVQAGYLRDQLAAAEAAGSTVVIQLDTAGTLDQDTLELARLIHDAKVPVLVFVGPAPAKAGGAGLLFMYASSLAAVSPGSQTGPLLPLDLADDARRAETPVLREMVIGWETGRAWRSVDVAFPDHGLTAREALDQEIAQDFARSVPELLDKVDGRTVSTAAGPVTLHTRLATSESEPRVLVRFHDLGPVDRTLHAAASPSAIYVLLVLAMACLAFETTQPGFGFAGFAGVAMLGLGVYGLTAVPFSWLGLSLLVAGVALMVVDVQIRRLGPFTALGLAGFVAGSILMFAGVSDQIDLSPWLIGSLAVASLLYYGFGLTVAVQSRDRITSTQRGLVGLVGEARGELSPEGPVFVKGTLWRGRSSDGPIPKGTRIRVRGVDGLILRVEPEPEDPAAGT